MYDFFGYICSSKKRRLRTKLWPFWPQQRPQLWPQSWPQPRGCPIQQCQYYEWAAVTTRIMSRFAGHNSRCYRRPFIVLAHCDWCYNLTSFVDRIGASLQVNEPCKTVQQVDMIWLAVVLRLSWLASPFWPNDGRWYGCRWKPFNQEASTQLKIFLSFF